MATGYVERLSGRGIYLLPVNKTRADAIEPYVTRDGSEIRELFHPDSSCVTNQSLAEATIAPGVSTKLHRHKYSEEIYHVTCGHGVMVLGDRHFPIQPGDSILIPPETPHKVENTGDVNLVILCSCSPAYSHNDTELLE